MKYIIEMKTKKSKKWHYQDSYLTKDEASDYAQELANHYGYNSDIRVRKVKK